MSDCEKSIAGNAADKAAHIRMRIKKLREIMKERGLHWYLIITGDYHGSEYVSEYFQVREFFSGFTGSNGSLLVSENFAGLWTDGRYFIQAEKELEGTEIELFRMGDAGVPSIGVFLTEKMERGQVLGFDGRVVLFEEGERYRKALQEKGVLLEGNHDLAEEIWIERPKLQDVCHAIRVLPEELAGESVAAKLEKLRIWMREKGLEEYLISKLDDLMWLLNIRGGDVAFNPVALSYGYVTKHDFVLFLNEKSLTREGAEHLKQNHITVVSYEEIGPFLRDRATHDDQEKSVLDLILSVASEIGLPERKNGGLIGFDASATCYLFARELLDHEVGKKVKCPIAGWKAIKNEIELKNIREVYLRDSAVLTRFLFLLKDEVKRQSETEGRVTLTEYDAAMELDAMRRQIPGCFDLSFTTISAYGANAAMMHYEATETDTAILEAKGLYLVDSGGQYLGGTTDVTRTIALGEVTQEMKRHFTLAMMGMLRLANATFLKGCTGRNLDILARGPLWSEDIDYKCGTGHGIGYILNVHEGPQNIRWRFIEGQREAVLEPGMIVSDEPGVYLEGSHGIRIENILEVMEKCVNSDGTFLQFSPLTFVPIDRDVIDPSYMDESDVRLLNRYHAQVCEKLMPFMETEEEKDKLIRATEPIVK